MEGYTKLRIIGTGSFGTVWLLRSKEKRRNYVLKEISLSLVEERQRSLVLNEVKVLSQLKHMNIIRYKEAFLSNGFLCIAMEYADEGDLSDRILKQYGQMLPKEQIIDWFIQLCLALKYIHGMNILHRDIKCQNIFISKENILKLGDFGIACVLQNTLDHAQTVIGTPYYLSPEICQRQPYNHKSDIWAMGCVLYEMITLRHPFESTDFAQLVLKILHGDFTPIPESHGTLLQDLVSILLRVDPNERPSAKQILHIPAMQVYVNKVLARGRTQRSESVSCSNRQSVSKNNVWRKPDVIPGNMSEEQSRNDIEAEEKSKKFFVDECHAETDDVVKTRKSPRKRISSEVFPTQDYRVSDGVKKMKVGRGKDFVCFVESDKENLSPTQHGPSKHRSYSTSIVRESAERNPAGMKSMRVQRSPLAPLNRLQVSLRSTYDVIPDTKIVFQDTYIKHSSCISPTDDIASQHSEQARGKQTITKSCIETGSHNDTATGRENVVKNASGSKSDNSMSQTEFFKVLLGSSHRTVFRGISPECSLKDYVQVMRSTLEERLGVEMFNALHKYLCFEVEKDLSSGLNICETFFQALDQDRIVFVPLMLQYIQCEKNLAT